MDLNHRSCLKRACLCLWLLVALACFCACATLYTWSIDSRNGYFINSLTAVSEFLYLEISPPKSTLFVWKLLIIWQVLWIIYAAIFMFIRKKYDLSQTNSVAVPFRLIVSFCLANILLIISKFPYDHQFLKLFLLLFTLASLFLHQSYVFGHIHLDKITPALSREGLKTDIWLIKTIVLNGLAYYAAFLSVVGSYAFAQVWTYGKHLGAQPSAGVTAGLAFLTIYIFVWLFLRFYIYVDHLCYICSPFFVWVVTLAGIILKQGSISSFHWIFISVLLATVIVCFYASVFRQKNVLNTILLFFKYIKQLRILSIIAFLNKCLKHVKTRTLGNTTERIPFV